MKKLILSAIALTVAGLASAQTSNQPITNQYDGVIRFAGEVIDQTCVVKADKKEQNITLAKVPVHNLQGAGKVAGNQNFEIFLEQCNTGGRKNNQRVRAQFISSPNVDLTTGTLINKAVATPATFVNLRLKESDGTPIQLGNASYAGHQYHDLDGRTSGNIQYSVEYYATGNATVGKVESAVEYAIVYE